jgi:hypothetical protein
MKYRGMSILIMKPLFSVSFSVRHQGVSHGYLHEEKTAYIADSVEIIFDASFGKLSLLLVLPLNQALLGFSHVFLSSRLPIIVLRNVVDEYLFDGPCYVLSAQFGLLG